MQADTPATVRSEHRKSGGGPTVEDEPSRWCSAHIREFMRQSTLRQRRDARLVAMAVSVPTSMVVVVPFAFSPISIVITPTAILAIPVTIAPRCTVVRGAIPPARVPDVLSLYGSPVAGHPNVVRLRHRGRDFITDRRGRCSDHDGDLAECRCRKG